MKNYTVVDESEAVNEDGSIKVGYEKRAYCYVKLDLVAIQAMRDAEIAKQAAKAQAIIDNLPSWSAVNTAIDNATTLAQMKVIVKKMAIVLYWLAKNDNV